MKKSTEGFIRLTQSEMEIMNILWKQKSPASVRQVIDGCSEPKPAYTTVGTFLNILRRALSVRSVWRMGERACSMRH